MPKRTYDDKMKLDMPFDEGLKRFVGVKPDEMQANIAKSKKKRPPGGKVRKPSDSQVDTRNVVRLRYRRNPNRG